MSIAISIDFLQLKQAIAQCNTNEKLEILQLLEKETFPLRFKNFLKAIQTDELSLEEITAEVEIVRQKRYATQ